MSHLKKSMVKMVMISPTMDNTLPMMLRISRAILTSFEIGGAFTFCIGSE